MCAYCSRASGLLDLGFDVFAVEELLFSSASRTDAAVERLKGAGVIFVSYKTLYFELTEAVADGPHADENDRQARRVPG